MVSFSHLLATLGLFSATLMASPAAISEVKDIAVFDSDITPVQGLEARQQQKDCLAVINSGLGPPSTRPFCGRIGVRPNTATVFRAATSQFPQCTITVEVNFPNCAQYRVVNVQNCGGERQIDIRETSNTQGC
ncbi:hypothetical protein diail_7196 [Diaporthe ilicicola]|nr:hypothetical protein diail_7196 [Diaporthe ilicicola]